MDQAKDAYDELQEYFRHSDPTHRHEDGVFEKLGYIDIQFLAPRVQAEVIWGIGLMDTICPPSTQFAAYNKIVSPKSMIPIRILGMSLYQALMTGFSIHDGFVVGFSARHSRHGSTQVVEKVSRIAVN